MTHPEVPFAAEEPLPALAQWPSEGLNGLQAQALSTQKSNSVGHTVASPPLPCLGLQAWGRSLSS